MSAELNLQYGVRHGDGEISWSSEERYARRWADDNQGVLVAREVGESFVVREPLPDVEGTVIWARHEGEMVIAVLSDPGTELPWFCTSTEDHSVYRMNWARPDELDLIAVVPAPEVES